MRELLGAIGLVLREKMCRRPVPRTPEPDAVMDGTENVVAFDAAAEALLPVYHLNGVGVARLLPPGGTLLDLGSGSGRFLAHFARRCPDARVVGIDLSEPMIDAGRELIAAEGLQDRVELRLGDMTDLRPFEEIRPDVVSSVFSLHHLPDDEALRRCASELRRLQSRGSAAWVFDHARPRSRRTAERFPDVFTPQLDETFRRDSTNSLLASWGFERLCRELGEEWRHVLARTLELYQVHWAGAPRRPPGEDRDDEAALPRGVRGPYRRLRSLFRDVDLLQ